MTTTDIFLFSNASYAAADVVLRPSVALAAAPAGGMTGGAAVLDIVAARPALRGRVEIRLRVVAFIWPGTGRHVAPAALVTTSAARAGAGRTGAVAAVGIGVAEGAIGRSRCVSWLGVHVLDPTAGEEELLLALAAL